MLIYSKKVEDEIRLFGTLNNIPSEDDAQLIYTDAENVELENRPTLDDTYLDNGKGGIIQKSTGEEIKVFIDTTNVIPGDSSEPVPPTPVDNPYLTFSSDSPFSISTTSGSKSWDGTLEYSTNTENWNEWNGAEVSSSADGKLYFRGSNNTVISFVSMEEQPNPWVLNGNAISCTGNIENLLDYQTVADGEHPQLGAGCLMGMFYGCTSLITAPELPATTLADGCYYGMFINCTSLITAPELPATILAVSCYSSIFEGCTSLTIAPELPSTTLAEGCYTGMFAGCASLTTAPELPATTLTDHCYDSMFINCTSLTTAPQLPATALAEYCYSEMFVNCTSLATAPELSATIIANECYNSMFYGCTSLTTAPQLPATTLADGCYSQMFYGCTLLTTPPELPATTLAYGCYDSMFINCTSLTDIPELPVITLAEYCYNEMFYGCTSLKLSETQDSDYITPYRIPTEGTGIDTTNALTDMFSNTGGTFTGAPTINTTYYLHKDNHIV